MGKKVRIPTDEEYFQYDGMHCRLIWVSLSHDWRCPVCDRTKRELLVWGKREGSNARQYGPIGFKCGIHKHHDHGADYGLGRFPITYICGACNNLDARLKRKLKCPEEFSFSPIELRQCLKSVRANDLIGPEDIDFDAAQQIFMTYIETQINW